MNRRHALAIAAAPVVLIALATASPAVRAQTGTHAATISAARPLQLHKVARTCRKTQQTAKATHSEPQSLRGLLSETP